MTPASDTKKPKKIKEIQTGIASTPEGGGSVTITFDPVFGSVPWIQITGTQGEATSVAFTVGTPTKTAVTVTSIVDSQEVSWQALTLEDK